MILLDGKLLAKKQEEKMIKVVEELYKKNIIPTLAVILVGDDAASASYVNMKTKASHRIGIDSITRTYHKNITENQLLEAIYKFNHDEDVDGILVQLPLPSHINTQRILEAIDPLKDVDGFHPYNVGRMYAGLNGFLPATPMGVMELLKFYDIEVLGKNVVIVGASNIVGKPLAALMLQSGATISLCHIHTKDISLYTKQADILCVGVGKPSLITKDMVKEGVVIVDIGINRLEDGRIVGDVDSDVVKKSSYFTPVPGGVGPMTIASLMQNTIIAAKNRKEK
ncbi:bifunctional methylenetetrahydrofolate dehydrogenase/methenyltetrahydrofolate cyclohydrolase FolD [Helicobacter anatolicus]|uniref:bifunctional methylenetetrahydrofolate dehydrogenase/methenyltetrahydrofolate cyclohydrolase FolD n=1 Tax=Helicobacter anatolicus TaxID=2905874 RepID=UPI001E286B1D|nr:bifunctional methylenetetrahydrofolate dehydrogenase/methenyltetrahydrofolate cyclohydrolase FolD [Helicobacter anatolicus]MCE3038023.1 bifunctional methylenetetrahydrofolate dehydrogenase/methenyltetrahydrofolate cyclohydrolase FolD [Helicobacter anatolicus]MCE3039387.1 bifunctional methylenetetrahydrofolate dehydrogenase/methenyltetrahydrofolate cyclohydrolase FolD [Helicobacter anatolicus]